MKTGHILGMNARNLNYLRNNKKKSRKIADSKLLTKKYLKKLNVPHPKLIKILKSHSEVNEYNWIKLRTYSNGFVIKPSDGWGGSGVLVIKKPSDKEGEWILTNNKIINTEDLFLHTQDIIEGHFSRNNTPDRAFIEERIKIHSKFLKYAYQGTPDIRIIICNKIPIMAMLRLPTKESSGKANLHQGAVALGIDMATGITTHGVYHDQIISRIPEKNKKVNGLVVPFWNEILKVAIDAAEASNLNYSGIDIVLDEKKGPMVIELNDQPGLAIQIANQTGLLERLKRVENLNVSSKYKGIEIAQILFAENFSDKVKVEKGQKIIGIFEKVKIKYGNNERHELIAKIDTGAYSVSIDRDLAQDLGLLAKKNFIYEETFLSSLGKEVRPVIEIELWLQGRKMKVLANIANRQHLRAKILIGRRYLKEFMVDPSRVEEY